MMRRMVRRFCAGLAISVFLLAQTPEELEKRIAQLPADRQVYERYRNWIGAQPVEVQRSPQQLERYREHLRASGVSEKKIETQIRLIREQGRRLEVERWNAILTAEKPRFNTNPNSFLVEMVKGRRPGTALDIGMGQGRHAIWLAQQGWTVTGFDPADKAVALARANAAKAGVILSTEVKGEEEFEFGENRWDLILASYVGARSFHEKAQRALKPGGLMIVLGFHRDATRGRPIGSGVVFDTGELPALFKALRTVRYEEPVEVADFGLERVRLVRFCAEKPAE
jgi:2-polyprenyl-3-methyl-5-hydroxy-6-metoxy-1,4-benzoquinol methylase